MPDCLIVAVLTLFILSAMFLVALCFGLVVVAWFAFSERRTRARYQADVARVQANIKRGSRLTDYRMKLR
jgi:ABC-type uncharacterized transport system permease subunit